MKKKYFGEIDGLRFYTFLLILINHTGIWKQAGGTPIFFTLSGFVIAIASFRQIEANGKFNARKFVIQRISRTFPIYYFIVISAGIVYCLVRLNGESFSFNNYWSFLIFLQNFYGFGTIFILSNLWAMAVTEQLYFGWAFLLNQVHDNIIKFLLPLALGTFICVFTIRSYTFTNYTNTLNYISIYLLGAYCGALVHTRSRLYNFFINQKPTIITLLFSIGILIITYALNFSYDHNVLLIRISLMSFGFCIVLLSACSGKLIGKIVLNNKMVRYLGKITYGLYCYHAIILTILGKYFYYKQISYSSVIIFFVTLLLSIVISAFSYEIFEKRIMATVRLRYLGAASGST